RWSADDVHTRGRGVADLDGTQRVRGGVGREIWRDDDEHLAHITGLVHVGPTGRLAGRGSMPAAVLPRGMQARARPSHTTGVGLLRDEGRAGRWRDVHSAGTLPRE